MQRERANRGADDGYRLFTLRWRRQKIFQFSVGATKLVAAFVVFTVVVVVGNAHKSLLKLRKFHTHIHTHTQASVDSFQHWPRSRGEGRNIDRHIIAANSVARLSQRLGHNEFALMLILLDVSPSSLSCLLSLWVNFSLQHDFYLYFSNVVL